MKSIWRDGVAAIVVAGLVFSYLGLIMNGTVGQLGGMTLLGNPPLVQGPRGMALVGLIVVGVLWLLASARVLDAWSWVTGGVAALTIGIGLAAVVTESWVVLASFMIAIVAMWAMLTLRDFVVVIARRGHHAGPAHI